MKIKILELFAGYGSQALALKKLGFKIDKESEIVEWAVSPIIAYNTLHEPYNDEKLDDDLLNSIIGAGAISNDTKKPAKVIKKNKKEALKEAIAQTNNMCDITRYNIESQFDLLTYSFPCQDLSNQGKQAGMSKGSGTRSGLLWEVERMLKFHTEWFKMRIEIYEPKKKKPRLEKIIKSQTPLNKTKRPKILLMENVKALVGKKNMPDFEEWIKSLEQMGYKNTWKVLNSAHFGIGQNRERVFMLSFLDEEQFNNFEWPNGSKDKTPFKKHMMSLEEIENSPWPINDKDLYLNEFELLKGQNGNYKLGNHIGDNKVFTNFQSALIVNDENSQIRTLRAKGGNQETEDRKVFSTFQTKLAVTSEETPQRTLETGAKSKVYQLIEQRGGIVRFVRPLEKARIMGLTDEQFWKLYNNPALSTNEIEAMLGNSIVVDVMEAIFKEIYEEMTKV